MPGDNRALEPPDPISNSEVKRCIADDSVGSPHVKVGHYQALIPKGCISFRGTAFFMPVYKVNGVMTCLNMGNCWKVKQKLTCEHETMDGEVDGAIATPEG